MTIDHVTLVSEEGTMGQEGVGYLQVYHVYFINGYVASALRNGASGLPKRGDAHATDAQAYCDNTKCKLLPDSDAQGDGTNHVFGIAEYSATFKQRSLYWDPDPLSRPAEIEWGGTDLTEVPLKDKDGKGLVNSVGFLYDGIPSRPVRGAADCTIARNEANNPATNVTNYSYTSNDAIWNGVSAGNAMFGKIVGVKQHEIVNGTEVVYWRVTYPIHFRKDGWFWKPLDNGWKYRVGSNLFDVIDDLGNKATMPAFLNGSGALLNGTGGTRDSAGAAGTDPVVYPTAGYKLEDESTWATLTLPNPFA